MERERIPVQCTPIRSQPVPLGLHACGQRPSALGQGKRRPHGVLHGRLAHSGREQELLPSCTQGSAKPSHGYGLQDKLGEVGPSSFTPVHLPGPIIQHADGNGTAYPSKATSFRSFSAQAHEQENLLCQNDGIPAGNDGISRRNSASWTRFQEAAPKSSRGEIPATHPWMGPCCSTRPVVCKSHPNVAGRIAQPATCASGSSSSTGQSTCGCFHSRLGSSHTGAVGQRSLVRHGVRPPHQSSRASGCNQSSRIVPKQHSEGPCPDNLGQSISGRPHSESRWYSLQSLVDSSREPTALGSEQRVDTLGMPLSWQSQCVGRHTQSPQRRDTNRVDAITQVSPNSLEHLAPANDRPVCDKSEQQTSTLRLPSPGHSGDGDRRNEPRLVRHGRIRFPPSGPASEGAPKSTPRKRQPHTDNSNVAMGPLVQPDSVSGTHSASGSRSPTRRPVPTSLRSGTQSLGQPQPPRLVAMRRALRERGLSKDSVELITSAQRCSTNKVYDNHWIKWCAWCRSNQVDPFHPTEVDIVNHLSNLAKCHKVSPSYVKVRRSAISSTLGVLDATDFSSSLMLSRAVRGLGLLSAKTKKRTPDWDIRVILTYLMSKEFEPLHLISLRNLTLKTCFLITLASGRRASEVLNLSGIPGDIAYDRNNTVSLTFLPEFLAKNQSSSQTSPNVQIRPLTHLLDRSETDVVNCPVRALKMYRKRTKVIRSPQQRQLFISFNPAHSKDIRSTTLSRWIRLLIIEAYKSLETANNVVEPLPLLTPRAHEVRAWASTLAFRTVAMSDLLSTAYWKTEDTFLNFYLRDVSRRKEDGTWGLPSCVAASVSLASSSSH